MTLQNSWWVQRCCGLEFYPFGLVIIGYFTCLRNFFKDLFICYLMFFEIGAHCATLTVLGVTLWTRLASSSEISLPLPPQVLVLKVKLLPSNLKIYFFIVLPVCVYVWCMYMCMCTRACISPPPHTHTHTWHVWYLQRLEEAFRFPGLPCGSWKLNLGPLKYRLGMFAGSQIKWHTSEFQTLSVSEQYYYFDTAG